MKQKFLKDLEQRLEIISEEERKDTIDEYSNIIDEKVKHGKTIKEAIDEFGDIDELSKEILKAYKINPDYGKGKNNKEFIKGTEDVISKTAQKLSDITEDIVDSFKKQDKEFNVSTVFEMIIKVILVLLGLMLLKLPFYIISEFGVGILEIGPFTGVLIFIWKLLVEVIYLVVCILLIMSIVNQYVSKDKKKQKNEEIREDNHINSFGHFLILLLKIWCLIVIIIPGICFQVGCVIALSFIIYLIMKGIAIYGILLFVIGITGVASFVIDVVWRLVFSKKKIYIYPMIFNIIFLIVGFFLSFDYISNITFINEMPKGYHITTNTYEMTISEDTTLHRFIEIEIDNTLEDQVLKFELTYSNDIYNEVKPVLSEDYIYISKDYKNHRLKINNEYLHNFIEDLSHNQVYNYEKLSSVETKVYLNENTLKMIQK